MTSNPIPVYVHPVTTTILLGPPSTDCTNDPASNCYNLAGGGTCNLTTAPTPVTGYTGTSCLSQGQSAQLVARSYQGNSGAVAANNISCLVGPLSFTALNSTVVTIDANGVATAAQPGSSTINANNSQSSSSAGFFSTCPPASIALTAAGQSAIPTAPLNVNQNTSQSLVATILDTKGNPITSIQPNYVSTSPISIPASGNIITPVYPGSATITAICQPPTCNPAPFNEIGLFGNGTPIASNPVQINAIGTNINTVLYIASTNSQYLQPVDFTLTTQGAPIRLPYVPNSFVISQDQTTIYMGTPNEIMVFSTSTNALTREDTTISGKVLAVSPDSATVVISDPVRKLTYLYGSNGSVTTEYGGVGTRASYSPDSQTVYITTNDNRLLVYSTFTGWTAVPLANLATDVAVTIPSVGAYLAGGSATTSASPGPVTARTNCPVTTITGTGLGQTTSNVFYPQAAIVPATDDRLIATNDGVHILGASTTSFTDITTNQKSGACYPPNPITFNNTAGAPLALGVAATMINNVIVTSDSAFAFVTYAGTGSALPEYIQSVTAGGAGQLVDVALQTTSLGTPLAAVSGVVSQDNRTFYTGTSGDNLVHRLTRGAGGFTDTLAPVNPALPGVNGGTATPICWRSGLRKRPAKSREQMLYHA